MKRLYLMITITNRVMGSKRFVDFYRAFGAPVVFTALGRGTASDEVLSYLGLEATEKSVMLSVVTPACKEVLMKELVSTMHLTNPGTGIAMCLPLSSIGGRTAMNYLITGNPEAEPDVEVKEDESMKDAAYQLIVAIANQGYTDTVMGAARSAGAHGGTILHAKSTGAEDAGKFFGMSIAEEREIILMVVPTGDKNTVMQAIMAQAGAHTEAQAVTFSVALEDVAGLYHINADEDEAARGNLRPSGAGTCRLRESRRKKFGCFSVKAAGRRVPAVFLLSNPAAGGILKAISHTEKRSDVYGSSGASGAGTGISLF